MGVQKFMSGIDKNMYCITLQKAKGRKEVQRQTEPNPSIALSTTYGPAKSSWINVRLTIVCFKELR